MELPEPKPMVEEEVPDFFKRRSIFGPSLDFFQGQTDFEHFQEVTIAFLSKKGGQGDKLNS